MTNIDSFSIITLLHISVNLKETFPLYMLVNEISIISIIILVAFSVDNKENCKNNFQKRFMVLCIAFVI